MHNRPHTKTNVLQAVAEQPAAVMNGKMAQPLLDNRPAAIMQKKQVTGMSNNNGTAIPVQKKANNTGLPDQLKSGVENLSGIAMDDVKVHYGSSKPAQVQAHAYAQGSDIHIAPGQEKHLPHEAWHVAQQKQGRVKPTKQLKSKVNINDDIGLENEADVMGRKALTQRFALHRDDTVQRAYNNMGVHPAGTLNAAASLQPMQMKTGLPGMAASLQLKAGQAAVLQRIWGLNWGSLPGMFVVTEGIMSITAGGLLVPVNLWQAVPAMVVGGTKLLRGALMIYNSRDGRTPEDVKNMKYYVDWLRMLETAASAFSIFAGTPTTPEEKRNWYQIATNSLAILLKAVRSYLHFGEGKVTKEGDQESGQKEEKNGYGYSMALQAIEALEGALIIVSGGVTASEGTLPPGGGLSVGIGTSKVIRGGISGGVAYSKGKAKQGENAPLVDN